MYEDLSLDEEKKEKKYKAISKKLCNSCKLELPSKLEDGICPHCKRRN